MGMGSPVLAQGITLGTGATATNVTAVAIGSVAQIG
jgi:hypothetical protein